MKTVWITALSQNQPRVAAVSAQLQRYGLASRGHFWDDHPDKLAWRPALDALNDARADLWLILLDQAEFEKPSVRYGLTLMALALRAQRGAAFPIVLLATGAAIEANALPQVLQRCSSLGDSNPAWPAKIVAAANLAARVPAPEYRLNVLGDERIGQWFELGPVSGSWNGVIFGVAGTDAAINFQASGPAADLPEKSVLEFPQQGLQIDAGGQTFTAWALRNQVDHASSYFARVQGCPQKILFMPYADGDDGQAVVLALS